MKPEAPLCTHCNQPARHVKGSVIYPARRDLHHKNFWLCDACDAWVGCHNKGYSIKPLGRPVNAEVRMWRMKAHAAFDPFWNKSRNPAVRSQAYAWLAKELGIPVEQTHIGWFGVNECQRVVAVCERRRNAKKSAPTEVLA